MTDPSGSGTDGQRRVPGPWVIVLGMHRAGTSAITGALAALGMALPPEQDLVRGRPDNPVHYESEALIALNDRILETMGGWWNAPPEVEPGWATSRAASAGPKRRLHLVADLPRYRAPCVEGSPQLRPCPSGGVCWRIRWASFWSGDRLWPSPRPCTSGTVRLSPRGWPCGSTTTAAPSTPSWDSPDTWSATRT